MLLWVSCRMRRSAELPRYSVEDEVGVVLDLDELELHFELNGERVCTIAGEDFPSADRPLYPVVVLDEKFDAVELLAGVSRPRVTEQDGRFAGLPLWLRRPERRPGM